MLRIYDKNITIHEVPLEKIIKDERRFIIEFDDIYEKRRRIHFFDYQGIKITLADNMNVNDYVCLECRTNDTYVKCILENTDLSWRKELKKNLESRSQHKDIINEYKHYVLDLGDDILEIIAKGYEEKKGDN